MFAASRDDRIVATETKETASVTSESHEAKTSSHHCYDALGRKAHCNNEIPSSCKWVGTAPFCSGECDAGYKTCAYNQKGDTGYWCAFGHKALCCQEGSLKDNKKKEIKDGCPSGPWSEYFD